MEMSIQREYPGQPVIGVAGVVIDQRRVLLVRRGQAPLKGRWSICGGCLELGETIAEGVERELREETGLEVRCVGLLGAVERVEKDAEGRVQFHYVVLDYLCERRGGEAAPGSDSSEVAWVAESELGSYELDDAARGMIEKAFRMVKRRRSGH
jgi:8-oxo-dGTP diphosphatase